MRTRRAFMTLIGSTAVAWPLTARAQQPATPVIGLLNSGSPSKFEYLGRAFRKGLSENGYVEGGNVEFEYRWAEGHYDRLPALAADLVRRQVTVITAEGVTSASGKGGDHNGSDRLLLRRRPGRARTCREPKPTRRQPYGRDPIEYGARAEAAGTTARVGPRGEHDCPTR